MTDKRSKGSVPFAAADVLLTRATRKFHAGDQQGADRDGERGERHYSRAFVYERGLPHDPSPRRRRVR